MTGKDDNATGRLAHDGLFVRAAILIVALTLTFVFVGPTSFYLNGSFGLASSAIAMAICLVCGLLALFVTEQFRDPEMALYQVLINMALRMGIPLAICMLIYHRPGPLTDAGIVYYLLFFYMITLLVETVLAVRGFRHAKMSAVSPSKVS